MKHIHLHNFVNRNGGHVKKRNVVGGGDKNVFPDKYERTWSDRPTICA
jgi:hypothetical protein